MPRSTSPLLLAAVVLLAGCDDSVAPPGSECAARLTLDPGVVVAPAAIWGDGVCLETDTARDVVVLVSLLDADRQTTVDILGNGFEAGDPDILARQGADPVLLDGARSGVDVLHEALRRWEQTHLAPRLADRQGVPEARAGVLVPPQVPAIGDTMELDVAVGCDQAAAIRTARVAHVGEHSVVVVDRDPSGSQPFSDTELQSFGGYFDTRIYPALTEAYGLPTDLDGNDRIVLFFTPASNALAPPGSLGVVGGFFWAGDLLPAEAPNPEGLDPCPRSDVAEVIHLSVPDPEGLAGPPVSKAALRTRATLAHEFQHLLNAGARIHVSRAEVLQETWLNEAMSYVAEELLFRGEAGPRIPPDLDPDGLREMGALEPFNEFVYNSVGRFNVFVQAPYLHSPFGSDGIETRGAAWSLLRYLLDRSGRGDASALKVMTDSRTRGFQTIEEAFGRDADAWVLDWGATIVTDDMSLAEPEAARFSQPSWNLPELVRGARPDRRYPVGLVPVEPGIGLRFDLPSGGIGPGAIRVLPGRVATLRIVTPVAPERIQVVLAVLAGA